ncbi:ABC transporter ATP-binding protein [Paenibacillus sacheonensis]|uniref:Uncharacterized protein n=1 Tax=Paenibacillus sacheonensis TaxID=742054 RepID=A0A7X5BY22_9BACL|nr:ABC transporter ATP-binding protein [Paenibacillus sacheonensis]MBM7563586.1 ABC-type multidrug transport system fused ATPase/permease subunit [Paenibacillus sacheonensis]NBC71118.1 hypothetical protein [Paenibacillus sacheonensis]
MERVERSKAGRLSYEHTFRQVAGQDEQSTLKFLVSLYRGNFLNLSLSVFFYLIKSMPIFVLPVVTANIINIVSHPGEHSVRGLWMNFAVIAVVILQNIPTHTWYVSFMSRAIRHVEAGIRSALVRKLQQLSITYHRDLQAGRLQSKIRYVRRTYRAQRRILSFEAAAVVNRSSGSKAAIAAVPARSFSVRRIAVFCFVHCGQG